MHCESPAGTPAHKPQPLTELTAAELDPGWLKAVHLRYFASRFLSQGGLTDAEWQECPFDDEQVARAAERIRAGQYWVARLPPEMSAEAQPAGEPEAAPEEPTDNSAALRG